MPENLEDSLPNLESNKCDEVRDNKLHTKGKPESNGLSDTQRARAERNRQRAQALRDARLAPAPQSRTAVSIQ